MSVGPTPEPAGAAPLDVAASIRANSDHAGGGTGSIVTPAAPPGATPVGATGAAEPRRGIAPPTLQARIRPHFRQFVKFCLVGGSGVFVNLAVFNATLLTWQLVTGHMGFTASYVANGLGFLVSVVTNYYLNRRWTFRSTGSVPAELSKFVLVSFVAYGVNLGIFTVAHTVFALRGNVSQLVAIACVMPVNFLANKLWSFRKR